MASKKYNDVRIYRLIYKLRNEGKSWDFLKGEIKKNFDLDLPVGTISNMYTRYLTQAHVLTSSLRKDKRRAKAVMIDWNLKLEEKFKQIDLTLTKLITIMNRLLDQTWEKGEEKKYIKLIPTVLQIIRETSNQLEFIRKMQERIVISQQSFVYSPIQMINIINKNLDKLEKEGVIKILPDSSGRIRNKDRILEEKKVTDEFEFLDEGFAEEEPEKKEEKKK